jgi:hypothetical protein
MLTAIERLIKTWEVLGYSEAEIKEKLDNLKDEHDQGRASHDPDPPPEQK